MTTPDLFQRYPRPWKFDDRMGRCAVYDADGKNVILDGAWIERPVDRPETLAALVELVNETELHAQRRRK